MVDILTRLENLADSLPDGSSVLLEADQLRKWVGMERKQIEEDEGIRPDLTVNEVAQVMGRTPGTIRLWIRRGSLQGYRLQNRELRVTRDAIRAFLKVEREEDNVQHDEPEVQP